jgi:hypothetical protein
MKYFSLIIIIKYSSATSIDVTLCSVWYTIDPYYARAQKMIELAGSIGWKDLDQSEVRSDRLAIPPVDAWGADSEPACTIRVGRPVALHLHGHRFDLSTPAWKRTQILPLNQEKNTLIWGEDRGGARNHWSTNV